MGIIVIHPNREQVEGPLIYLLGPLQGVDWQSEAIGLLAVNPNLHIASPRGFSLRQDEFFHVWEKEYISRAKESGAVLFWLPKECGSSAEVLMNFSTLGQLNPKGNQVVFGIEEGFPGGEEVVKEIFRKWGVTVFSSLPQACNEAIRLCGMV